jgi:hypothetical protein
MGFNKKKSVGLSGTWLTPEVLVYIQTIIIHAQMLLSTATSMPSSGAFVGVLGKSLQLLELTRGGCYITSVYEKEYNVNRSAELPPF